jgi:hypothetical protein
MATKAADRETPAAGPQGKAGGPVVTRARIEDRMAAENLGAVYASLARDRALPLDVGAIPSSPIGLKAEGYGPLDAALSKVYGTDTERQRKYGRKKYPDAYSFYKKDYDNVISRVGEASFRQTRIVLVRQERELRKLHGLLTSDAALNKRLHDKAVNVRSAAGELFTTNADTEKLVGRPKAVFDVRTVAPRDLPTLWNITRARVAPAVKNENEPVLSTLFVHPAGIEILHAYSKDTATGQQLALSHVEDAVYAAADFREELTAPGQLDHFWRYPPLVWLGVAELGLADVKGFKQYTAAIGQLRGRNPAQRFFSFAGQALGCLALVFAGPVGMLVIAAGGLFVAGAELGFAFMRDRERDLAARASSLSESDQKIVAEATYADTAMAGAAALLQGIAFFGAAKAITELAAARPETFTEIAKPPRPSGGAAGGASAAEEARATATAVSPETRALTRGARGTTAEAKAVPSDTEPRTGSTGTTAEAPPTTQPRQDAVPVKQEDTTQAMSRGQRATDESVNPSNRSSGSQQRAAESNPAALRSTLDSEAAVERHLATEIEKLVAKNPEADAIWDEVERLIADLAPSSERAELIKEIRIALKAMRDPKRIARVAARVWTESQAIKASKIPPSAQELAKGLTSADSRAVARLVGFSPETAEGFEITGYSPNLPGTRQFFDQYGGKNAYFVDTQFTGDHGAMTHMFQDLLMNDAFAEAGIALDGKGFRAKLARAKGPPGKIYTVDKENVEIGNKLFVDIFDASATELSGHQGTTHRPETLYRLLKGALPELE